MMLVMVLVRLPMVRAEWKEACGQVPRLTIHRESIDDSETARTLDVAASETEDIEGVLNDAQLRIFRRECQRRIRGEILSSSKTAAWHDLTCLPCRRSRMRRIKTKRPRKYNVVSYLATSKAYDVF